MGRIPDPFAFPIDFVWIDSRCPRQSSFMQSISFFRCTWQADKFMTGSLCSSFVRIWIDKVRNSFNTLYQCGSISTRRTLHLYYKTLTPCISAISTNSHFHTPHFLPDLSWPTILNGPFSQIHRCRITLFFHQHPRCDPISFLLGCTTPKCLWN